MSSGRISKKEYHDLLSELFYDLPDLSEFDLQNGRNDDDTLTTPEPQPITSRSPLCTQPIEIQSIRTISSPPISIQPITNQPTDTVASVACQSIATTHMTYLCVNPSLFQPLPTFVSRIPLVEPMPVPLPIIIVTNTDSAPVPSIANARLETLHHSNRSQKELYKRLEHDKPIDYVRVDRFRLQCELIIVFLVNAELRQHPPRILHLANGHFASADPATRAVGLAKLYSDIQASRLLKFRTNLSSIFGMYKDLNIEYILT